MSSASATRFRQKPLRTLNDNSASLLAAETPRTVQSPVSAASTATESKSNMFSELFTDDLFNPKGASLSPQATSPFTSPRVSGSPSLQTQPLLDHEVDLGRLAKEDPLATQVWKMYARQKAQLPHAQRMENLTWRMMALALKKKKDEESRMNAELTNEPPGTPSQPDVSPDLPSSTDTSEARNELGERGRRIDKGKARVRVIGFDGTNEDGLEEDE